MREHIGKCTAFNFSILLGGSWHGVIATSAPFRFSSLSCTRDGVIVSLNPSGGGSLENSFNPRFTWKKKRQKKKKKKKKKNTAQSSNGFTQKTY